MRRYIQTFLCGLAVMLPIAWDAPVLAEQKTRPIYVISDLHMGVGKEDGQNWHRLEDFRWPKAFDGFLNKISRDNPNGVDLVIAGDFFDLWQHPTVSCAKSSDSECGCTIEEMKEVVRDVILGHSSEFAAIGRFLAGGAHQVFVIPGNHDAALMEDEIWDVVAQAIPEGRERFRRIKSETWFSPDGKVAIEHGHQHSFDANYFPDWPRSVTKSCADGKRFLRPWGENLVQTLYNDVEMQFPLIDNLIPESLGISIYYQYSKREGTTIKDLARFAIFNLLQTSPYQKIGLLDVNKERTTLSNKSVDFCRRCIGEDLILRSPEGERYRFLYGISGTDQEKAFRLELRHQVTSLEDNSVRDLCERVAVANKGKLEPNPDLKGQPGCGGTLGTISQMIKKIFDPDGVHVLRARIDKLNKQNPALRIYVFGHTHEAKLAQSVRVNDGSVIIAFNTGAFQRLMDRKSFNVNKKPGENNIDELRRLTHGDMKPCYTILAVTYDDKNKPTAELRQWYSPVEGPDEGVFLTDCAADCSARPANCR